MAPSTESFRPPTPMDPYSAGSTSLRSGSPDWVLLHMYARISDLRNTTTVVSKTRDGQAVEVSFWLVDAPGVSYFSVHCPGLKEDDFAFEPYVVCAEASLVLFCFTFNIPGGRSTHYFVYRAGPGEPALHLLPDPDVASFSSKELGLLPCGGADSDHYAVVFLSRYFIGGDSPWQFDVQVFSSQTQAWSSKAPLVRLSESDKDLFSDHATYKQIKVGRTSFGWVDLLYGILLLRNIFDKNPVIEYIQYPAGASRPCITEDEYLSPEYFRDIICCNGLIKFVDVEFLGPERNIDEVWKANTWNMMISENLWRKRLTVHVDNISVDQSYSSLLPELRDDKTEKLDLKKLIFYAPTLSMHDDDFLYVMSKVNDEHDKAWVIKVDMKNGAVEAVAPFSANECNLIPMFYPCAFPKYLSMTPVADMVNPMYKYFKGQKWVYAKKCAWEVLSAQRWLRELDQSLESERPSYIDCSSLHCSISSLRFSIGAVVEYASCNGQSKAKAASKAVDVCLGALEDLDLLLRKSLSDPSISTKAMRSKINITLQALDNVLQIASPAVMARGTGLPDACRQKGRKSKCENCEIMQLSSDAKLFDKCQMGHTNDKSDKLQQVRSSAKKTRRKKKNQALCLKDLKLLLSVVFKMCCILLFSFTCMYACYVISLKVIDKYPSPSVLNVSVGLL